MMLLAVSLVFVAALMTAAELAARGWIRHGRAYYVFAPGQRQRLQIDRETLPEMEPLVRNEINSDGERGPEAPRVGAGGMLYRVLVAGGSQPEGYFLDQDTSWPGALGRLLAAPERLRRLGVAKVHVGSIAKSGVDARALETILARVLPRYRRLSAIVILVGASDVLRWLEEGAPVAAPSAAIPTSELFGCHPEGPFGWTPRTLALVELARRAHRRLLRPTHHHSDTGRWLRKARAMRARAKVIRATMPDADVMLEHFEIYLRQSILRARQHADRVVVVRQSWFRKDTLTSEELAHMWHGGAGRTWREEVTTFYSIEVTSKLMALMDARAAAVATALGVEQIDLPALLEPNLATYYDYFHLTPSGARTVAEIVADALLHDATLPCVDLRAS